MDEGLTGLEQHEGEQLMIEFHFGWTIPLKHNKYLFYLFISPI